MCANFVGRMRYGRLWLYRLYNSGDVHVKAILLPVDTPEVLVVVHIDRVL